MDAADGFVRVGGRRIHYARRGRGGEEVLLLHGNGQSLRVWGQVLEDLAQDAVLTAWDLPGQGDSDPLATHLGIDEYADQLVGLMDALSIESAHVVGASVGGQIAVSLAARAPARVRSAALVEANFRPAEWWVEHWDLVEQRFVPPVHPFEAVAAEFRGISTEFYERWTIDRIKAGRSMMSVMWALREYGLPLEALARVSCPVLLVYGDAGPALACRDDMLAVIPGARDAVLDDCRHFPMVDAPEALSSEIRSLLVAEADSPDPAHV